MTNALTHVHRSKYRLYRQEWYQAHQDRIKLSDHSFSAEYRKAIKRLVRSFTPALNARKRWQESLKS